MVQSTHHGTIHSTAVAIEVLYEGEALDGLEPQPVPVDNGVDNSQATQLMQGLLLRHQRGHRLIQAASGADQDLGQVPPGVNQELHHRRRRTGVTLFEEMVPDTMEVNTSKRCPKHQRRIST